MALRYLLLWDGNTVVVPGGLVVVVVFRLFACGFVWTARKIVFGIVFCALLVVFVLLLFVLWIGSICGFGLFVVGWCMYFVEFLHLFCALMWVLESVRSL